METKTKYLEDMGTLVQGIPDDQQIFICGDLNGHVGKDNDSFDPIHGGYGYIRNNGGKAIQDFILACDIVVGYTYFERKILK